MRNIIHTALNGMKMNTFSISTVLKQADFQQAVFHRIPNILFFQLKCVAKTVFLPKEKMPPVKKLSLWLTM